MAHQIRDKKDESDKDQSPNSNELTEKEVQAEWQYWITMQGVEIDWRSVVRECGLDCPVGQEYRYSKQLI